MEIKGLAEVIKELRSIGGQIETLINHETNAAAFKIAKDAKILAPKNFGKLAQSIGVSQPMTDRGKALESRAITVNELYGGYMEFGTGAKVRVPDEFKETAESFRNQKGGTFEQGLEAIKVWCRAKGIDEKAAYPIFAKILGAGINPQPFLYPAWIKGKKEYLETLKKVLSKYGQTVSS